MSYYTERHGMRAPIEKTYTISIEMYSLLFDCCARFFDNVAWQYPAECPDGNGCCGLDLGKLSVAMSFEIPELYKNQNGIIDKPQKNYYETDEYNQYALLDFIEFMYGTCKDIASRWWHSYHRHDDISFSDTKASANEFRMAVNAIFEKTGLLYNLSEYGMVERIIENSTLSKETETAVAQIKEKGIQELLNDAILLYKTPAPSARQNAVEKIWDALERLKTYYTSMDKKSSASKIVTDMANSQSSYVDLFNAEFKALTDIGNNYRIRHHETDKIDINDDRYYDYFFNRCLSLIALAIQYLK